MRYTIYGLCESGTDRVRYIGVTALDISDRRDQHVKESKRETGTHKRHWIRAALDAGRTIDATTLDGAPAGPDALWLERLWIAVYRACGAPLVNAIDGGHGTLNPTAETRRKLSKSHLGRRHTEETKLRMRKPKKYPEGRRSRQVTEQFRERMREIALARPALTEAQKVRLRGLRVGKPHTLAWRANKARQGRAFHAAMREGRDALVFSEQGVG